MNGWERNYCHHRRHCLDSFLSFTLQLLLLLWVPRLERLVNVVSVFPSQHGTSQTADVLYLVRHELVRVSEA